MSAPRDVAAEAARAMEALGEAARDLRAAATSDLLDDLDRVARAWLQPGGALREEAIRRVSGEAGLSPEGVAFGIDAAFSALGRAGLEAVLARELPDPEVLDGPAVFPRGVSVHVQAGNVFTAALPRIFASLLARCPALVKAPSRQGAFSELLERSFREAGGRLAGAVRALSWRGGDEAVEARIFGRAGAVMAYGTDRAVEAVRARVPVEAAFLGFGHRLSVAVVGRERASAEPALLGDLALDVCAYDQRGCLSVQALYVEEGGALSPRDFAEALAREGFPEIGRLLPPGPRSEEELAGRFMHLQAALFDGEVWEGEGYAVCYRPDPVFEPGCAARVLDVRPLPDLSALPGALAPVAGRLQGVAAAVEGERLRALVSTAAALGASRICPPGRLQRPPATWRNDGHPVLLPFLRFVDLD